MEQNASSLQAISSTRDKDISRASPPRARVPLRVGVTGHRPNKQLSADEQRLRHQIDTALRFLKEITTDLHHCAGALYLPGPPVLRVISPLTERSDRFVAEAGLALGVELQCPVPFPREEYEKDFKSEDSSICWIDYRLLAEQLRQQRFLMALVRVLPSAPVYAHLEPLTNHVRSKVVMVVASDR